MELLKNINVIFTSNCIEFDLGKYDLGEYTLRELLWILRDDKDWGSVTMCGDTQIFFIRYKMYFL